MDQNPSSHSRWDSILGVLPAVLISDATGVIGLLIYKTNKTAITKSETVLALSICHFIINLSLPFAFLNNKRAFTFLISVLIVSCLAILGAGLSYLNLSLLQGNTITAIKNQTLFQTFNSLLFLSLTTIGLSLGISSKYTKYELLETPQSEILHNNIQALDEKNFINIPQKQNLISLKASAATLVDPNQILSDDCNSFMFSSISRITSKVNGFSDFNRPTSNERNNYSIKKLSIIKQSNSSTDIFNIIPEDNSENNLNALHTTTTPVMSKIIDVKPSKNLLVERDAIKRIPSVLLPPHLRPQEKTVFSGYGTNHDFQTQLQPPVDFSLDPQNLPHSQSFIDYRRESIPEEDIIQQIPRSTTIQEMYPYMNRNTGTTSELQTISLEDWGTNSEWFKKQQYLKGPPDSYKPYQSEPTFGNFVSEEESDRFTITEFEGDKIDESCSVFNAEPNDLEESSAGEVLRYVDNVSEMRDQDFYEGGIDQSYSTLHLNDLYNDQNAASRSGLNSPQKSIFRSTSRRNSNNSFVLKSHSASVPSSPRKTSRSNRSSPRKNKIKNLSLSSIVYKDEEEAMPNLSYVHELQSSSNKRRSSQVINIEAKIPKTPTKASISDLKDHDESKNTPDSNRSITSNTSFPSDVIGQYDREKWKTLQRLNMVQTTSET